MRRQPIRCRFDLLSNGISRFPMPGSRSSTKEAAIVQIGAPTIKLGLRTLWQRKTMAAAAGATDYITAVRCVRARILTRLARIEPQPRDWGGGPAIVNPHRGTEHRGATCIPAPRGSQRHDGAARCWCLSKSDLVSTDRELMPAPQTMVGRLLGEPALALQRRIAVRVSTDTYLILPGRLTVPQSCGC